MPAAQRSERLAALFPPGVAAAEMRTDGLLPLSTTHPDEEALAQARALLSERESQSLASCRAARIRDYTAGRLCAHQALGALGIQDFELLPAADRRALWPSEVSGSITHTRGYAAAVAGPLASVGSLGVDTECIEDVEPAIGARICTVRDREQCAQWAGAEQARARALCFVAKEAFYKAQYPICQEPLDFEAVWIELPAAAAATGVFQVHPLRALRLQRGGGSAAMAWPGRFLFHAAYVSAGIAVSLV